MTENKLFPHEGRIQYFSEQLKKQSKRKSLYFQQIEEIKKLLRDRKSVV